MNNHPAETALTQYMIDQIAPDITDALGAHGNRHERRKRAARMRRARS